MSTNLKSVLDSILHEKETNLLPENIRYGTSVMDVRGTLRPFNIDGGDTATMIHLGDETPITYNGVWLNTDKTYDDIYIENGRYTNQYSYMYSNDVTDEGDIENIIRNVKAPVSLEGCSYVQRGNTVHFFGHYACDVANRKDTTYTHQHYKYNFDTNTWTKLIDTPTPQGLGGCVWIGDYIYLLGSVYENYYNYVYKYDTINDSYERLADLVESPSHAPVTAVQGDNNFIYYAFKRNLYKYDIETQESTILISNAQRASNAPCYFTFYYNYEAYGAGGADKTLLTYIDGKIYCDYFDSDFNDMDQSTYIFCYDVNSNTATYPKIATGNYVTPRVYVNGYWYEYVCRDSYNSGSSGWNDPKYASKSSVLSSSTTQILSKSSFSTKAAIPGMPIVHFTHANFDIICCIGDTNQTIAMTLEDKTYNFENNTLLVYSTTNSSGMYRTQLFQNSKILNDGRLLTSFDDINLYDKETETIIKNISTYYGDGTQWIQIK